MKDLLFREYISNLKKTLDFLDLKTLSDISLLLLNAFKDENQIFTCGNGGSASTASHFICDLNKGVRAKESNLFKAICLSDNQATLMAYANDYNYEDVFVEPLRNFLNINDIVIGFSGSGNSENVLNAINFANNNGGITIGFSGFDGGGLASRAQYSLIVPVNDMQQSEDIHLIICHMMMQFLLEELSL